jgi:exoribonuclease R
MPIPGVLILEGNFTYGRTNNLKRLLYKCIPNDRFLPSFLVPFEPDFGFSKCLQNRFVVMEFESWNRQHPMALLKENLGPVNDISAFCEYQLYRRSIHDSLSIFNKELSKSVGRHPDARMPIEEILQNPRNQIELSKTEHIFTIDPAGSTDHDDALSIIPIPSSTSTVRVSVYIANVYVWLNHFHLWRSFSNRVATIYLPDCRRPMMPTLLSEKWCSLTAGKEGRFVFCMEIEVDMETGTLHKETATFNNKFVCISNNYVYEEPDLLASQHYRLLFDATKRLDKSVTDSTDVVSFWMVQMNTICGELMRDRGVGIFRETVPSSASSTAFLPSPLIIQNWKNLSGQYTAYTEGMTAEHAMFGRSFYAHITSPIRRIVDLLNQIMFMSAFQTADVSVAATEFVQSWIGRLDYVNTSMRSIRKVQLDCDMLNKCSSHPEWMEQEHEGVVFDGVQRTDGLFAYMVHLKKLNLLGRFTTPKKIEENAIERFRIFIFGEEDKLQRKIRVGLA